VTRTNVQQIHTNVVEHVNRVHLHHRHVFRVVNMEYVLNLIIMGLILINVNVRITTSDTVAQEVFLVSID
jgi:hypothetical protein